MFNKVKTYVHENKDKVLENKKQYYNRVKKDKVQCLCGSIIPRRGFKRHTKSKKHHKFMEKLKGKF